MDMSTPILHKGIFRTTIASEENKKNNGELNIEISEENNILGLVPPTSSTQCFTSNHPLEPLS